MDGSQSSFPSPLADVLAWMDARLDEALTLDAIAARAGFSPYHFSRLFTARMGHSVMAHLRGRRLVKAAQRMLADPKLKLIDLAFDCGFESQEAFTRAFKRTFGVAPGRFRHGFSIIPIEGQFPLAELAQTGADVVRRPDLVDLPAFTVIGFSRRFDDATKSAIPQLWSQLTGRLPIDGMIESWDTYGLVWGHDRREGSFAYMAAVGLKAGATTPEGFERLDIPAARYAVFRIALTGGALHPQVKAAMAAIWGKLMPESGLKVADTPDFELYDGEFRPDRPGAVIDFHVPVEI